MSDKLLVERSGAVATLVINNAERRNAITLHMWRALPILLDELDRDPAVRAIIVTGAGRKAFASGADITEFDANRSEAESIAVYNVARDNAQARLTSLAKPVIAKVNGYCIGGGLAVALCCDVRFATPDARFGIPAAKLGLSYPLWGVRALLDVVGPSAAKDIFFSARQFSATEAHAMGLVNYVVPGEEIDAACGDYARNVAANAPLTHNAIKIAVTELLKDESSRDLAKCQAYIDRCYSSEDYVEGRAAFAQKRNPVFSGR